MPDNSCDLALLYLVLHHVPDRRVAAGELARVLRPGGRLLIRTTFVELSAGLLWYRYFPSAPAIEARIFPTLADIERTFDASGFTVVELTSVRHHLADSFAEYTSRMKHRAISTFEHMSEEEIAAGFARMEADAAAEMTPAPVAEDCSLLVLARNASGRGA